MTVEARPRRRRLRLRLRRHLAAAVVVMVRARRRHRRRRQRLTARRVAVADVMVKVPRRRRHLRRPVAAMAMARARQRRRHHRRLMARPAAVADVTVKARHLRRLRRLVEVVVVMVRARQCLLRHRHRRRHRAAFFLAGVRSGTTARAVLARAGTSRSRSASPTATTTSGVSRPCTSPVARGELTAGSAHTGWIRFGTFRDRRVTARTVAHAWMSATIHLDGTYLRLRHHRPARTGAPTIGRRGMSSARGSLVAVDAPHALRPKAITVGERPRRRHHHPPLTGRQVAATMTAETRLLRRRRHRAARVAVTTMVTIGGAAMGATAMGATAMTATEMAAVDMAAVAMVDMAAVRSCPSRVLTRLHHHRLRPASRLQTEGGPFLAGAQSGATVRAELARAATSQRWNAMLTATIISGASKLFMRRSVLGERTAGLARARCTQSETFHANRAVATRSPVRTSATTRSDGTCRRRRRHRRRCHTRHHYLLHHHRPHRRSVGHCPVGACGGITAALALAHART